MAGASLGSTLAVSDSPLGSSEFLYATLANVLITLTALIGIVMLLCTSCTDVFQLVIQFCVSLAVGSLTGDALLHLLPMVSPKRSHERTSKGSRG